MKTLLFLTAIVVYWFLVPPALAQAASPSSEQMIMLKYPDSALSDVLRFYATLTHRKVWVELGVDQKVTVVSQRPVPLAEALSIIRGSLLQAGIEIREVGDAEAFVSPVSDPTMQSLRLPSRAPALEPPKRIPRVVRPKPTPTP